jgi:hypothetical protein
VSTPLHGSLLVSAWKRTRYLTPNSKRKKLDTFATILGKRKLLAGTIAWGLGTALHTLADLPAIINPSNAALSDGVAMPGLVLFSLGSLAWFAAIQWQRSLHGWRKWLFLLAGLWIISVPAIQVPFFIIPSGSPLMLLPPAPTGCSSCSWGRWCVIVG